MVFVAVSRDRLTPGLLEGICDVTAANLGITNDRRKLVDFSVPALSGVKEVTVTASDAAPLKSVNDLAGREAVVRPSLSYYEGLTALNERFCGSSARIIASATSTWHCTARFSMALADRLRLFQQGPPSKCLQGRHDLWLPADRDVTRPRLLVAV